MNNESYGTKEMVAANFKIPSELRKAAENLAEKRGTTFSRVIREALDLFIRLDAPVWPTVQDMADTYGLPESKIVRNIILKYIGEMQAKDDGHEINDQRITIEFSRTRGGSTLGDEELIAAAKKEYTDLVSSIIKLTENIKAYTEETRIRTEAIMKEKGIKE